jgi:nickel superoxide dismutase
MNMPLFVLTAILKENKAFAHCDIPCGMYDPNQAQLAAHTILRMTQLLSDLKRENETKTEHDIARITLVKEEHSSILEKELDTLRNDYFKNEHYKEYPNLNDLFIKTFKACAKARQGIDETSAQEVLAGVEEIAEIFFKTKNVTPTRVKSIYPTGGEIVTYK